MSHIISNTNAAAVTWWHLVDKGLQNLGPCAVYYNNSTLQERKTERVWDPILTTRWCSRSASLKNSSVNRFKKTKTKYDIEWNKLQTSIFQNIHHQIVKTQDINNTSAVQRHACAISSTCSLHLYSKINGIRVRWPRCCTVHTKHFTSRLLWTTGVGCRGAPSTGAVWVLQCKLGGADVLQDSQQPLKPPT